MPASVSVYNMARSFPQVELLGMPLASVSEDAVLDHIFGELRAGRGGWLVTANLDFLRRFAKDVHTRDLLGASDLMVADGMPLVWASRLLGQPLPERVAGSALIYRFAERAASEGRTLYFFGGEPGAGEAAARVLRERWPALQVVGHTAPQISAPPSPREVASVRQELHAKRPDLVLVGLGSPKQEQLIHALRAEFPQVWMVGVGISFSFVAGRVQRAPAWMRQSGLEWIHRLAQEPGRLAKRYLVHDLPFAAELFTRVLLERALRKGQS